MAEIQIFRSRSNINQNQYKVYTILKYASYYLFSDSLYISTLYLMCNFSVYYVQQTSSDCCLDGFIADTSTAFFCSADWGSVNYFAINKQGPP